jgi:uncharacterized protein (DUF305 family)
MKIKWILLGSLVCAATAFAQMDMSHMDIGSKTPESKFTSDMDTSMEVMDKGMASAPMTGDADHDFASMMIPHHQGAIDMAKAELLYGKDPTMRRLAQEIIADQKSEIDLMNLWLKKHAATQTEDK